MRPTRDSGALNWRGRDVEGEFPVASDQKQHVIDLTAPGSMRYILVGKNGIPTHGKIISLQDKILVLGIFACTRENRDGKHRTSEKMGMGETTFDVPICTQADFWKRLESAKLGDIFTLQEIANHVRSARRGVDECLYIGKGKVTASQPFVFACSNVPFCSLPPSHN